MNSSFDTTCVGIGESTPFFISLSPFRIHISFLPFKRKLNVGRENSLNDPQGPRRLLRAGSLDQILFVQNIIEPADHHLFPGLITPAHFFGWIGIVLVLCRIVEVRNTINPGPLRQENWVLELVKKLPVEIVSRNL